MSDDNNSGRDITRILDNWRHGDGRGLSQVMEQFYDELRTVAQQRMVRERQSHTLQPSALVSELYLRLVDQKSVVDYKDRAHFLAVAAVGMRQILVDHARKRNAWKRGGGQAPLVFDESLYFTEDQAIDLLEFDHTLEALARIDSRKAKIIELRFFGGLTLDETGEVLGISRATIKRDSKVAKALLWKLLKTNEPVSAQDLDG